MRRGVDEARKDEGKGGTGQRRRVISSQRPFPHHQKLSTCLSCENTCLLPVHTSVKNQSCLRAEVTDMTAWLAAGEFCLPPHFSRHSFVCLLLFFKQSPVHQQFVFRRTSPPSRDVSAFVKHRLSDDGFTFLATVRGLKSRGTSTGWISRLTSLWWEPLLALGHVVDTRKPY